MKKIRTTNGYTLLEMLIAVSLTGILAAAGFEFYDRMHSQTVAQEEISYMQQTCRASLEEIAKTLRMAGYRLSSHAAYSIHNDSLFIFYRETQPVDTVLYFLQQYTPEELGTAYARFAGDVPAKLMKRENSAAPVVFSDYIKAISFVAMNSSTVQVSLRVQTSVPDESFAQDNGFRSLVGFEQVILRNVAL